MICSLYTKKGDENHDPDWLCDDDPSVLDELHELLGSYRTERNADIAPTASKARSSCWRPSKRAQRFDILLLDVLMPGENGIEAARGDPSVRLQREIIFLTHPQSLRAVRIRWARISISSSRSGRRASSG